MKIPTALEILEKDESGVYNPVDIVRAMKEFARIHVEACKKETKKAAYVKDPITGMAVYASSKRLNKAYPLSKIK